MAEAFEGAASPEFVDGVIAYSRVEAGELGFGAVLGVAVAFVAADGEFAAEAFFAAQSAEGALFDGEMAAELGSRDPAALGAEVGFDLARQVAHAVRAKVSCGGAVRGLLIFVFWPSM